MQTTWSPDTEHGVIHNRAELPESVFAFPMQRKEPLTDADHVRKFMTHLIHRVMRHMTMHEPVAGIVRQKFDGSRLSDANENSCFGPLRRLRYRTAIGLRNLKGVSVEMDGMVVHRA